VQGFKNGIITLMINSLPQGARKKQITAQLLMPKQQIKTRFFETTLLDAFGS